MVGASKSGENGSGGAQEVGAGDADAVQVPGVGARGKGRVVGSKNKLDRKLGPWIEREYGRTPAMELARRAFMPTADYAREVGLVSKSGDAPTKKQIGAASRRQEGLMYRLLPYTEKRMPTELVVDDKKRVILQIGQISAPDGTAERSDAKTIELVPANIKKSQQNQQVSNLTAEKSDNEMSDEES